MGQTRAVNEGADGVVAAMLPLPEIKPVSSNLEKEEKLKRTCTDLTSEMAPKFPTPYEVITNKPIERANREGYISITEMVARLLEKYQGAFFTLNDTYLKQRAEQRIDAPLSHQKLSKEIHDHRWVPIIAAVVAAGFSMGGAYTQNSHKTLSAACDSIGKIGVNCVKESAGYSHEARKTGLQGEIQVSDSEARTLDSADNEASAKLNELQQAVSTIARAEENSVPS